MSYSRWGARGSGFWYTYWHCSNEEIDKDNAIFCIHDVAIFTAKELRDNIDLCMIKVGELEPEGDTEELRIYANEFLVDVDKYS